MRKTPSYLKGLAETRARAHGDMERYQKLADEIAAKIAEAKETLESCDRLIRKFDIRLDPAEIPSVKGWQGRYGKRGALSEAIIEHLRHAYPNDLSTTELSWLLQLQFRLDFSTSNARTRWHDNTLRSAFRRLRLQGIIERVHELPISTNVEVGRWRLKSDAGLLADHLMRRVAAMDASVLHDDDALS